ncbi:hypothetical protein TNIN_321591 [Trichonephila inaurata madagascariensis]|uniref:Integrase catalytic domain-containing protein n=1 Tax=Trichonephila inaurata madagascariensis TaxID=2747483 RepID=A0A8X6WN76_9ARAC|nr:hypothetical protein TNIN_321591 [Trichonephila inaurata madagascariensis]
MYFNTILRYAPPSVPLSERGTEFTARHTQRLVQKYEIPRSKTPPYPPQANTIVERVYDLIVPTLKKLTEKNPDKWNLVLHRDATIIQNNSSDEENESAVKNQNPAENLQDDSVANLPSPIRKYFHRNRRPPKRFE